MNIYLNIEDITVRVVYFNFTSGILIHYRDVKKNAFNDFNAQTPGKLHEIFICTLLEFCICNKEKKNDTSSQVQIKVNNDKTKTNGVEIIFNIKP